MFFMQILAYWIGFGLIADAMLKTGHVFRGWALAALSLTPLFLMMTVCLHKDVGMAVAFLLSFAIVFRFRTQGREPPSWAIVPAFVLLAYGILARANGAFAGVPLLIYFTPLRKLGFKSLAATTLLLTFACILAGNAIDHTVFQAERTYPERSLQLFDLAGIAVLANDGDIYPDRSVSLGDLRRCYSPIMWDTLHMKGCAVAPKENIVEGKFDPTASWIAAILRHPVVYLEHRIFSFNSFLYFYVPTHHTTVIRPLRTTASQEHGPKAWILDWLRFGLPFTPVFWLVVAVCFAASPFLGKKRFENEEEAALFLIFSAGLYLLSFLPFGVATDLRYELWSMMAFGIGGLLLAPTASTVMRRNKKYLYASVALLALTVSAMAYARHTGDIHLLNPDFTGYHSALTVKGN